MVAVPPYRIARTTFDDTALQEWWQEAYHAGTLVRNTFFQSWEWNKSWYSHYVRNDARRTLVLLRIESGDAIIGAVPLFLQTRKAGPFTVWRYFLWIADRLSQYPDMITTETEVGTIWHAVLHFLHEEYPDAWLTLHDVLPESTAAGFSPKGSRLQEGEPYLRIDLADCGADGVLERCVPHMQREILRSRRLLAEDPAIAWQMHPAPKESLLEQLIRLNRERFGASSWFSDRRNERFFMELCNNLGNELLISVIMHEGEAVHLMASYLHAGTVHYVLSGMDARAKRLSPGTMNLDATIRWALREGFRFFDFLRGDEGYKREFCPDERHSVHLTVPAAGARTRFALARAAQRGRRTLDRS